MKLGYTLPETLEYFDYLFKNREKEKVTSFDVPLGGEMELVDVFEVPIELPRYRLNNTRTIALQEQHIKDNKLPSDYFESDPLSDTLQEVQHGILTKLISRKDLKTYFESSRQTHPLVVTADGFVISGNRRLCAFRELVDDPENAEKYKHFKRVRVAILPRLSEEEIEYIEDHYEQQQDIQDAFGWVSRALGFRKRLEKHATKHEKFDVAKLSARSGVKKATIESLLNKLSVAEEYLTYLGKEKQYDLIETDEFAFKELLKARKKFENDADPGKKEIFQALSFVSLKFQDQISDRMYKNIPVLQEVVDDVIHEIEESFPNEIEAQKAKAIANNPLEEVGGSGAHAVLNVIDNVDNQENIFSIVYDKVIEHKLLKQDKKNKEAVLKQIQKAHKELVTANNLVNEKTKKEGIVKQLENIEKEIVKLRNWLNGTN